jgi:excisionase family DNA binding protein
MNEQVNHPTGVPENTFANLCTPKELALLLKVPEKTIYYWVSRKDIPYIKIGRHLRFKAHLVLQAFEAKTEESRRRCFDLPFQVSNRSLGSLKIRTGRSVLGRKE